MKSPVLKKVVLILAPIALAFAAWYAFTQLSPKGGMSAAEVTLINLTTGETKAASRDAIQRGPAEADAQGRWLWLPLSNEGADRELHVSPRWHDQMREAMEAHGIDPDSVDWVDWETRRVTPTNAE